MILFDDIVEIFALPQTNSAGESTLGFQGFHCRRIGRVLIHVDDPRNGRFCPVIQIALVGREKQQYFGDVRW
jgi:hypothetical protein